MHASISIKLRVLLPWKVYTLIGQLWQSLDPPDLDSLCDLSQNHGTSATNEQCSIYIILVRIMERLQQMNNVLFILF